MSDRAKTTEGAAADGKTAEAREARRRFLKVTGAAALAIPVIETVTGKDLLTTSVQAASVDSGDINGPFTGSVDGAVG